MIVPSWDDNGMGTKVVSRTKYKIINLIGSVIGYLIVIVLFVSVCMSVVWLSLPEDNPPLSQEEYVEQLIELQDNVIKLKKELIELQELRLLELEGKAYLL